MQRDPDPRQHRTTSPAPDTENATSENTNRTQTAEQACRECRRRKSKCDRTMPVCRLCGKFARICTYEKASRTPLTRTYLSHVEGELARTKRLLARFMPEVVDGDGEHANEDAGADVGADDRRQFGDGAPEPFHDAAGYDGHANGHRQTPDHGVQSAHHQPTHQQQPPPLHNGTNAHGRASIQVDPHHREDGHSMPLPTPSLESHHSHGHSRPRASTNPVLPDSVGPAPKPTPDSNRSVGTTAFSLETPPSSSNFEWDERAGGDKFVDGMASLTSRSNEGGYLGSASGAALLRLTETRPDGPTSVPYESDQQHPQDVAEYPYHRPGQSIPFALTSMSQLEPFIDAYFRLYHASYPIVHEATFRAQFMEIIPRPQGNAWQVLLFVIAALGVFTSATQPTDIDFALFDAAKERLSIDVLETGNLILVQALVLISNYLQKRNKPNSGYNYMGLARRVAMGIGLHKEFPTWDASLLTLEMRRRVWYCLYIFDIGAMITFSRPLDFPNLGVDVLLPVNAHDSDITATTTTPPPPAQESTIYTHLLSQSKFHLATSHIYSKIISHPLPPASELLSLDDQFIESWLAELPPYFNESAPQPPKFALAHAILRWRYRNFRILMYRPFLVGQLMARARNSNSSQNNGSGPTEVNVNADTSAAIERCLSSASSGIHLIALFWSAPSNRNMMACWYGLYFLFQAVLIPVICLRNEPQSHLAQSWREQVLTAVDVLEGMSVLNSTARRCLGVIEGLCGGYLRPPTGFTGTGADGEGDGGVGVWAQPTEESPQTQLANLYPLMWPTLEIGSWGFDVGGGANGHAGAYGNGHGSGGAGLDSVIQESTIMDFMSRLPM
ncbi:Zn(II)2Cys6 transcription factor domain-containing protein [Aspergillus stella-maris]|uniref:Zn(II)2Cys6 transcription factor domain-containing protein n=1 Tax=Aspergillus stella-maris TaxID=1810926 RepID=UPI003CCD793A